MLLLATNVYLINEALTVSMSPGAVHATICIDVHNLQRTVAEVEFQTSNSLLGIWQILYYYILPLLVTGIELCAIGVVFHRNLRRRSKHDT